MIRKLAIALALPLLAGSACSAAASTAAEKCDGKTFNIPVEAGDERDRDGDGIACEKN